MPCVYVDGVPVVFGEYDSMKPHLAPLGDRVTYGTWDGEYPLTGDLLRRSLALCDGEVAPLLPRGWLT